MREKCLSRDRGAQPPVRIDRDPIVDIHERVLAKNPITPAESTKLLLYGNHQFVNGVRSRRLKLLKLSEKPLNELFWLCSDARAGLILNPHMQVHQRMAVGFLAGNVISLESPVQLLILIDSLTALRSGGVVRVIGHTKCGAVNHADGKGNQGQPEVLRSLLDQVMPGNESVNAIEQLRKLNGLAEGSSLGPFVYSSTVFDWNNPDAPVQVIDETTRDMAVAFRRKRECGFLWPIDRETGRLPALDTQYAHAVVVTSIVGERSIPATLREVFGVYTPNELFCVTANSNLERYPSGFDALSLGSIFYSLANNQTNHVVLVHADPAVLAAWKGELTNWFERLAQSTDERESSVGKRFESGEIAISPMVFNFKDGSVE